MRLKRAFAYALGTWFGCGRIPLAPGTAGTLGAIPLYLIVRRGAPWAVAATAVIVTLVGVWAASQIVAYEGVKDPQHVVIDEVAGMLITLVPAPHGWRAVTLAFIAFRIFDQFKPWPARAVERKWRGGLGVVFDDVFAGLWGALIVLGAAHLGVIT